MCTIQQIARPAPPSDPTRFSGHRLPNPLENLLHGIHPYLLSFASPTCVSPSKTSSALTTPRSVEPGRLRELLDLLPQHRVRDRGHGQGREVSDTKVSASGLFESIYSVGA
eukprot:COSAG04_NODE_380_length_15462_cov_2.388401_17_plen_111_part_00